jgi:hypothetical protein
LIHALGINLNVGEAREVDSQAEKELFQDKVPGGNGKPFKHMGSYSYPDDSHWNKMYNLPILS